jgi:nicotinamidase-related amidase
MTPTLLLMDYQEAVCRTDGAIGRSGSGAEVARRGVLSAAARTLAAFRDRSWPVVFVRVAFDDEFTNMTSASPRFRAMRKRRMMMDSDPETAICSEVAPRPGETVITKGCVNPFVGTRLAQRLISLETRELVLGGVATNHVVESTARLAADMGYDVVVLEDLCAGFTSELHDFSVREILPGYGKVTSSEEYVGAQQ